MKNLFCVVLIALVGCSTDPRQKTQPRNQNCLYEVERDLTVPWSERKYWCAPKGYAQSSFSIKPKISPPAQDNTLETVINGSTDGMKEFK